MSVNSVASYWWEQVKEEGSFSILAQLLFLILVYGLLIVLIIESEGGGTDWIFARFPIFDAVRDASFVEIYVFWLVSLWIGFKFGKQAGMAKGAVKERKRIGIPL